MIENKVNSVVLGIVKHLCVIILVLSILIVAVAAFVENFDLDLSTKNTTLFATLTATCAIMLHFSFQARGMASGKMQDGYITNEAAYKKARAGRTCATISDFIAYSAEWEKEDFIKQVCERVGKTEDEIRILTIKDVRRLKTYGRKEKKLMKRIILRKYPNTMPKSPYEVLNILGGYAGSVYGIDTKRKKRFIASVNLKKVFNVIIATLFVGSLAVEFVQSINWAHTIFKISLTLFTFCISLFGGYMSGFKATSEIEKDTLFSACQFFSDMDIWLKEQGRKTRYTPDEFTSKETDT